MSTPTDDRLTLYWCPATRAVRGYWMVEELGVDYDLVEIDIYDADAKKNEEFQAASPMGKVPAITHVRDGVTTPLSDSATLCLYLADAYPESGLAPPIGHPDRGRYLYWMTFVPGVVEPVAMEKLTGAEPNRLSHGWGDFDAMQRVIESGLARGPWLLGDNFSAADVMVGSAVHFLSQAGVLPADGRFGDYVNACLGRPAYQRALAAEADPDDG